MERHALLIGCATFGLKGCDHDLALMSRCLSSYGFEMETLTGAAATRAGVLQAYEQLIARAEPNWAVVIYYSGHGGILEHTDPAKNEPDFFQYLVPVDYPLTADRDFCGILDLELSRCLARLTERTDNVTLIFDCCHAARISRGENRSRAIPQHRRSLRRHLDRIRFSAVDALRDFESNPRAVRLTAAGIHESAYEYRSSRVGGYVGLFTEALVDVLEAARGHELSWSKVIARVREWVSAQDPRQRPGLAGPADRLLFETHEDVSVKGPVFFYDSPNLAVKAGKPALRGGQLMDVHVGDVYALIDPNSAKKIGVAKVTRAGAAISHVEVKAPAWIRAGTPTVLIWTANRASPVAMDRVPSQLRDAVRRSPFLKIGQADDLMPPIASAAVVNGLIEIREANGRLAAFPSRDVEKALANLVSLSRARALYLLEGGRGDRALNEPFELVWGRVEEGLDPSRCAAKDLLYNGEKIFVKVVNQGRTDLWVHLINVGVSRKVTLLNRADLTTGAAIKSGQTYIFGHRNYDRLVGRRVAWPQTVPADAPRMEHLVVILSDAPQDFSILQSGGMRDTGALSTLQAKLYGMFMGVSRSQEKRVELRYAVRHISFELSPEVKPSS